MPPYVSNTPAKRFDRDWLHPLRVEDAVMNVRTSVHLDQWEPLMNTVCSCVCCTVRSYVLCVCLGMLTAGDGFVLYMQARNRHLAVWVISLSQSVSWLNLHFSKHLLTLPGEAFFFLIWICYDTTTACFRCDFRLLEPSSEFHSFSDY